ncbi:RHS repeat protein [Bacteroides bouchesdurhonensis]|uniref:RHS repeat protein n=1 Tax=Bacteroides bouchesdurhonensis TaxID=1841855 RepID=UPI0011DDE5FC|nr:RHS repeat protein [Bacteroides bouchesdurhonensis]
MKKNILLTFIWGLCLTMCIPQAMAQKQGRMEKLLRYLNDNDTAKWQKNREKLDNETQTYYADALSLMDILDQLWNKQSEQAATNYFGRYERATEAYFPAICEAENIDSSNIRNRADKSIIDILEVSKNKIPFSRVLLDSIRTTGYPMDSTMLEKIKSIRELALMENMVSTPTLQTYQIYIKEYPNGKYLSQVNIAENKRLYQLVKNTPNPDNFKAFFEDKAMQKFFQDKGPRPYLSEVRTLYDDYLFQNIDTLQKKGDATAIRQIIDEYKDSPYLTPSEQTHLNELEFISEQADFELLKPNLTSSESLHLLKKFLATHKYKEFRDQANALRQGFILQSIVSTPNCVKCYNQGRLTKVSENDSTGIRSTTYSYNDKGQVLSIVTLTEKNGQTVNQTKTSMLYDPLGHCIFEVKTDPKTQTDLYRRIRHFNSDGSIESDSLKYMDGKLVTSNYNKQGLLTEVKEYNKNGELQTSTTNKYDDKGRLLESQYQNLQFTNSPAPILSQKEIYEYDKYGYLKRIVYQRISSNNQKTDGYLTCIYDEYGNRIDGNSYYEYDNTGQWICRTNYDNPNDTVRIQHIYK